MMTEITSVEQLGTSMMTQLSGHPQEECWLVGVSTQMRLLCQECIAIGTANSVTIHPRDIFRRLVAVNAYGFVIIHNHPSGSLRLSEADQKIIDQLAICSDVMQYHFLDFMLVSINGYLSYRAIGKLPNYSFERLLALWTEVNKM